MATDYEDMCFALDNRNGNLLAKLSGRRDMKLIVGKGGEKREFMTWQGRVHFTKMATRRPFWKTKDMIS